MNIKIEVIKIGNYKMHSNEKMTIDDVVLETDKKHEKVKKVKLKADVGDITWRAKIADTEYVEKDGYKIEVTGQKRKPAIEELPEIVHNIKNGLEKGPVNVIASYKEWIKSDPPTYSMTDSQLYGMEIVDKKKKK